MQIDANRSERMDDGGHSARSRLERDAGQSGNPSELPGAREKRVVLVVVFLLLGLGCLYQFPPDDGLRHIGHAFGNSKGWGTVYPYSLFEDVGDYNPWLGYDLTLRWCAAAFKLLPLPLLLQQFLLTKILCCLLPFGLLTVAIQRSKILSGITDRMSAALVVGILVLFMLEPVNRALLLRPFVFGTLFVLYSIGRRGFIRGLVSSAVVTFLYPYLSWLYVIPVGMAHLLKGDKRFAAGSFLFLGAAVSLQPQGFWTLQEALFAAGALREDIAIEIGELDSSLNDLIFYLFLGGAMVLHPLLSPEARRWKTCHLLILFFLLPAVIYERYFLDLILPLLLVVYGKEMVTILRGPCQVLASAWADLVDDSLSRCRIPLARGGQLSLSRIGWYFTATALVLVVLVCALNYRLYRYFREYQVQLSIIPSGSLVLSDFNTQFKTLYVRPDLRFVPSCELGFPRASIRQEYLEFLREGNACPLAHHTKAQFLLTSRMFPLSPETGDCVKPCGVSNSDRMWRVSATVNRDGRELP